MRYFYMGNPGLIDFSASLEMTNWVLLEPLKMRGQARICGCSLDLARDMAGDGRVGGRCARNKIRES